MELKDCVALFTAILGVSGLSFGLYQYYVAQKWKKSEFAAKQLELLNSNPELSLCCRFLDWRRRELPIPEQYQAYTDDKLFEHNWTILAEAMMPGRRKGRYTWQQAMYRDHFDHFFEYLQSINHYLSIDLISIPDVITLKYWLEELGKPRFANKGDEQIFMGFIKFFEYNGVLELMKRFEVVHNDSKLPTFEKINGNSAVE